jgi:hypothetical protein
VDVVERKRPIEVVPNHPAVIGGVLKALARSQHPQWHLLPKRARLASSSMRAYFVLVQSRRHHIAAKRPYGVSVHQINVWNRRSGKKRDNFSFSIPNTYDAPQVYMIWACGHQPLSWHLQYWTLACRQHTTAKSEECLSQVFTNLETTSI